MLLGREDVNSECDVVTKCVPREQPATALKRRCSIRKLPHGLTATLLTTDFYTLAHQRCVGVVLGVDSQIFDVSRPAM